MNDASNWFDVCDEQARAGAERLVSSFPSQPSTRQDVLGRYIKVFAAHFKRECDRYSWPDNDSGNSDSDAESMITVKKKPFFRCLLLLFEYIRMIDIFSHIIICTHT